MSDRIFDEALEWHVQLGNDDADWGAFTAWLERSPEHAIAYERVTALDDDLARVCADRASAFPANDDEPAAGVSVRQPWYSARGRIIAASLVALLAMPLAMLTLRAPSSELYATKGDIQVIALENGSQIVLDRNSRLTVREGNVAEVELLAGAAFFDAPGDPDQSFSVRAGQTYIRDVGTRFDVSYDAGFVEVAVSEGRVQATSAGGRPVDVGVGWVLLVAEGRGSVELGKIDVRDVASWRNDKLVYHNAPLMMVAADIARHSGQAIKVDPALGEVRFSGVLDATVEADLVASLALILGLQTETRNDAVHILPGA